MHSISRHSAPSRADQLKSEHEIPTAIRLLGSEGDGKRTALCPSSVCWYLVGRRRVVLDSTDQQPPMGRDDGNQRDPEQFHMPRIDERERVDRDRRLRRIRKVVHSDGHLSKRNAQRATSPFPKGSACLAAGRHTYDE